MLWVRLISLALSAALLSGQAAAQSTSRHSRRVRIALVEAREPRHELRFSGVTRAIQRASLSFTIGGRLAERQAELGSRVAKGSILARLELAPLENAAVEADAALSRANVQWRRARRERERVDRLYEVGGRSRRDREDAHAAEQAARVVRVGAVSRLDEAERRLDEASLRAPFSGTISQVLLEPGEYAKPGSPVVVVAGDSGLEVVFDVPEAMVADVRPGSPVSVHFPMSAVGALSAPIFSVGQAGQGPGALFPVVVRLAPHEGLLAGMSAEVTLKTRRPRSLLVPIGAVINPTGDQALVLRVRDGRAERVDVDVIELIGKDVVVVGALEVEDAVIVSGHGSLLDGDPVDVAEPPPPASSEP